MGANIAKRLHDLGYPIVALYDVYPQSAAATAEVTGGEVVSSPARVTALADVILTVVTDDAAMYRIFADTGESLLANAGGKIFVNCATVSPKVHVDVERLAEKHGANSLEACMASSIPQARNGTLYLMVGGRRGLEDELEPAIGDGVRIAQGQPRQFRPLRHLGHGQGE